MHVYICSYIHTYLCTYISTYTYTHTYIHTYVCTYTYTHVYVYTYIGYLPLHYLVELLPEWLNTEKQQMYIQYIIRVHTTYIRIYVRMYVTYTAKAIGARLPVMLLVCQ